MTFISFTTRPLKRRVCYHAHNNSFYVSAYVVAETVLRADVYYALWRFASSCRPRGFKGINIFLLSHFALHTIGFSVQTFKGPDCLALITGCYYTRHSLLDLIGSWKGLIHYLQVTEGEVILLCAIVLGFYLFCPQNTAFEREFQTCARF